LDVKIYSMDSQEAKGYTFKSSTHVLFQNEPVPLAVATDRGEMESFLSGRL